MHAFNFGDITWWDRLFGTFRDTDGFTERCGFAGPREQRLGAMLRFEDVHRAPRRPRKKGLDMRPSP